MNRFSVPFYMLILNRAIFVLTQSVLNYLPVQMLSVCPKEVFRKLVPGSLPRFSRNTCLGVCMPSCVTMILMPSWLGVFLPGGQIERHAVIRLSKIYGFLFRARHAVNTTEDSTTYHIYVPGVYHVQ